MTEQETEQLKQQIQLHETDSKLEPKEIDVDEETKLQEKDEEKDEEKAIKFLHDIDHTIPKFAHSETDAKLNEVDVKHKHNLTVGDVEFKKFNHGKQSGKYWFAMEKYPDEYSIKEYDRVKGYAVHSTITYHDGKTVDLSLPKRKMFISINVDRIVSVDTGSDTFRAEFSIYFRWLAMYSECKKYYESGENWSTLKDNTNLQFENVIEEHSRKWEKTPDGREFKMQCGWLDSNSNVWPKDDDTNKAMWISAGLECDITFREQYELQSYPFDCQDLTIKINDMYEAVWIYLPHMYVMDCGQENVDYFSQVNPQTSSIENWELENVVLEIGDCEIIINIKLARRWKPVVTNTLFVMFLLSVLSLTVFTIPADDTSSRLGVTLTLILTAVLFDTQSVPRAYLTFMDYYFQSTYFYLALMTFVVSFVGAYIESNLEDVDNYLFIIFVVLFVMYHIAFIVYARHTRLKEMKKLNMTHDEIETYNLQTQKQRDSIALSYNKRKRAENGFVFAGIKTKR